MPFEKMKTGMGLSCVRPRWMWVCWRVVGHFTLHMHVSVHPPRVSDTYARMCNVDDMK